MTSLIEKLTLYFSYSFVTNAMIAGVMIALCSSLLGVILVLKRFSFIGDGLSHSAFGALAVATVLQINNTMFFVMPITVLFAVLIICGGEGKKVKGDASIAMFSVGALAIGYLVLNIFSPSANLSGDVCSTLFGSTLILTLKKSEVILSVVLSIVVVLFFILNYNKIFAVTFDEPFAKACGTKVRLYNLTMAVFIAVIIVLALNLVGSLLISALIIFPAVAAMQVFRSFRSVTIGAAVISVLSAALGIVTAVLAGTPVGPTIVAFNIAVFFVCKICGLIRGV